MRLVILVSLAALAAAASTTNKLLKSIEAGVSVDDAPSPRKAPLLAL